MSALERKDRARAFVPELIPEPKDLDRSGPLDAREERDLDRVHAARDNHQNARWMRGKALEAAFRRRLFRGEDGTRTRQQYLDDEWDGISESAAYLEIREWRLAAQIAVTSGQPAPDSHVRALVEVAEKGELSEVSRAYIDLRAYGKARKLRVTATVAENLAHFLSTGTMPAPELVFVPRQLPQADQKPATKKPKGTPAVDNAKAGSFQNFGMTAGGSTPLSAGHQSGTDPTSAAPAVQAGATTATVPGASAEADPAASESDEAAQWDVTLEQSSRLTSWIRTESVALGVAPGRVADLLLQLLEGDRSKGVREWMISRLKDS